MAETGKENPYEGRFGIIRRIDDWIFTVEMGILWTFLGVSGVMVFLDVVYRRLAAPDSKVAELAARIRADQRKQLRRRGLKGECRD